jgi:CHAT domain-containing protein
MPLAALPLANGDYLGTKFQISYAPGAQVLKFCADRDPVATNDYGIVENATDDLNFTPCECHTIATLNQVTPARHLIGKPQATVANYRQLLKISNNFVSSHHAVARLDNPLESALQLGDGNITLGQLMSPGWRFKDLVEVFMSCCETHLGSQTTFADEPLTLTTGYLCAGARGVIGTLWSVEDAATAIFSCIYHYHRRRGIPRAAALQQAQSNLRNTKYVPICIAKLSQILIDRIHSLELQERAAYNQMQSSAAGSPEHQHFDLLSRRCDLEQQNFRKLIKALAHIGTPTNRYQHPFYWAGFTCNGLGS